MGKLDNLPLTSLDKLKIESAHDQALRDQLKSDPVSVLQQRGIDVGQGVQIQTVEDDANTHHLVLPPFVGTDVSPEALAGATADSSGTTWCTTCTATSPICIGSLASLTCAG